jgi:hypothetical protein
MSILLFSSAGELKIFWSIAFVRYMTMSKKVRLEELFFDK